VLVAMKIEIQ